MKFYSKIIDRYVNNVATDDELEVMDHLIREGELDEPLEEHMQKTWAEAVAEFETEKASIPKKIFLWKWAGGIAASLLLFVIGYYMFQMDDSVKKSVVAQEIVPGTNKAILTLANGQRINLNDADNGEIARLSGVTISKSKDGMLIYSIGSVSSMNRVEFNTVETPKGAQYIIKLPDGTSVMLNAASKLKFPTSFSGSERKVELVGEGYFEVAKDKTKPFIVQTENQQVEVLGTHFNVKGYTDESVIKTTLLEGAVRINGATYLKPGEQAVLDGGKIKVVDADLENEVAWKNGRFAFTGNEFENIMRTVSRWYDVEIIYDYNPKGLHISGGISKFENIKDVLELIEETGEVKFKIEGRRIRVIK